MTSTADLDLRDRARTFAALSAETFDVLVVGGGITGAGIARDAAMRGLRTALVEAEDFASGTSSRSTKLVHGGLRYLAQGDFAIVREAARERRAVRRIAPHLAVATPVIVPARSFVEMAKLAIGLRAFDWLGAVAREDRHEVWSRRRLADLEPCMDNQGLVGAAVYPEYITDDARLVIANVRSAAAHGAVVASHAAVTAFTPGTGRVDAACVGATLPGEDREARVRARVIVNASGPWVDVVRRCEDPAATRRLMLTKGIHVVVRRGRLPLARSLLTSAPDGRSVFVVPRGGFVYIGTTDTFQPQPEYWPDITATDIDYLLATAAETFSVVPLTRDDIVAAWAGLRPLLLQPGRSPSEASRRDEMVEGVRGVITIAGGKLTAYRKMAERVVNRCQERLGLRARRAATSREALPGGDFVGSVLTLARRLETQGLAADAAERVARLYGSEAQRVLALEATSTDGGMGLAVAEVEHAVRCEGALTLEDWWMRRSARGFFDPDRNGGGGIEILPAAASRMAVLLGWSEAERERQVEHCRSLRAKSLSAVARG